jgi:hypothetical protein
MAWRGIVGTSFTADAFENTWQRCNSGFGGRDDQKWSLGPHLITPGGILAFSPLTGAAMHSPAWNSISWGVETVGEFEREPFARPVRDSPIAALSEAAKTARRIMAETIDERNGARRNVCAQRGTPIRGKC